MVWGTYIFRQWVVVQLKLEEFESGGLFRDDGLRARKSGRQKDFVLLKWKSDTTWKTERKTETDFN